MAPFLLTSDNVGPVSCFPGVFWSWTDCKFSELESDMHSLSDINACHSQKLCMPKEHNISELVERLKFKEANASGQGHKASRRQNWDWTSCVKKTTKQKTRKTTVTKQAAEVILALK